MAALFLFSGNNKNAVLKYLYSKGRLFLMCKINSVISEKADAALKRCTEAEVRLLEILSDAQAELFNEFIDENTEYEDCIMQEAIKKCSPIFMHKPYHRIG